MSHRNTRARNELEEMRLPDLQARFREVTGETSRSPNRKFLIRRIEETLATRVDESPARTGPSEPIEPTEPAMATAAEDDVESAPESGTEDGDDDALTVAPSVDPEALDESNDSNPAAASPGEVEAETDDGVASAPPRQRGRFASMTIEELQTKYLEVVGRATGSDDLRYLIWKIREAEKGRVPVGPRSTRKREGEPLDVKILPLRLEADAADKMDEAWRARGIKSRMEFFRGAIGHYLAHLGAADAAALFGNSSAPDA